MNKPKIYEELEEKLSDKISKDGDSIEWLRFPNGQLFSEPDPAIRGMVMEAARGNDIDGYGAMIAPRHALAVYNPGGIDFLTRNEDGTFGVCGAMFKDGRFIWGEAPVSTSAKGYTEPVFWHKFSDGLLIQWGQMAPNVTSVTYPIPYTNFYSLVGGPWYGTTENVHSYLSYISGMLGFESKTNTGFTRTGDAAGLGIVRWFLAIGY